MNTMDTLLVIKDLTDLTFEQALAFLAEKRTFIEGRGDPDEYEALADEYDLIGAEANAANLRRKAAGMRAERKDVVG